MTKRKAVDNAREVALFRYSLVRPLLDPRLTAGERGEMVRDLVSRQHRGPTGEMRWVSRSSVDRWARLLRMDGFESLIPQPRHVTPRTGAGLLELAEALKRERPARTASQVARIMRQTYGQGPSARTLQRHFARLGLNKRVGTGEPPQAHGRFEAEFPNELWISDGLHAGTVRGPIIEGRETVLFAIIDDHSRFIVYARWGFAEDVLGLQAVLHDAVKVHGCPDGFYCDNGGAYVSGQLAWTLAVLNIRIVHSRVGQPRGRGKIERWNLTCRMEFLVEVETGGGTGGSVVSSLAELNRLFHAWVHHVYHQRVHTETGQTPAARYHHRAEHAPPPRRPDLAQLRRAFLWREKRKVTSYRTVSLHGNRYEVDAALIDKEVDLLFSPFDLSRIEVELNGQPMGLALPNKIGRHVHPAVTAPTKKPPAYSTGIDYLRLLETAHQAQHGLPINFPALTEPAAEPSAGDDDEPQA